MLKEFISRLEQLPRAERAEQELVEMIRVFHLLLNYLKNRSSFPNKEINKIAKLMGRLIDDGHIPIVLEPNIPSIAFLLVASGVELRPHLLLPRNFIYLTGLAPEVQLGILAYAASQCRDFFCNKIRRDNSEEVNRRARAWEAEALITLKRLADQERVILRLLPFQEQMIDTFPNGLKSLERRLRYNTPPYRRIYG
ncbi:MAG: hypothetical protein PVJ09_00340 [Candidatus Woesebacteria bacterium]|jgi:hypothetical protein